MSFYTMVDGLFVSNIIGTDALSAINLTAPVIRLVTAISTMPAAGGSAVLCFVWYLAAGPLFVMLVTMLVLPRIFGVNGIWLATPAAELMALALSGFLFFQYKKRYGY